MHARLVSYLSDNRDQIIESWLTEADLPAPAAAGGAANDEPAPGAGVAPCTFFEQAFDAVLQVIQSGDSGAARRSAPQLGDFLGRTCECRARTFGGRVCMELHDSGLDAFLGVLSDDWDVAQEFSALDREICAEKINHALSGFFGHEVEHCPHKETRHDCPFSAYLPGDPAS
ncbi:MAG: hypothetical protein ACLFU4_03055 [Opitutales bacterium]